MGNHTVKHNGKSYDVNTSTHVDDHPSDESWIKKHQAEIATAIGVANAAIGVATITVTHKPKR